MRKIFPFFFAFYSFILSILLLPLYTDGDQAHYIRAYEGMRNLDLLDAFFYFKNELGSSEPVVFLIYYIASPFLSKVLLVSFSNAVLGYCLGYLIARSRATPLVYPLFFLNFYLLVLLFSAERLKFGIIFLGLYLIGKRFKNFFAIFSILSHSQTLIILVSVFFARFGEKISEIAKKMVSLKGAIYLVIGASIIYLTLGDHIATKLTAYSSTNSKIEKGFPAMIKPLIFIALSLFYCKRDYGKGILLGFPMLIAAYFLGAERIAIFSYAVFIYFAINFHRGLNAGVILTSIYFSYQGAGYVQKIINYGNGFYGA